MAVEVNAEIRLRPVEGGPFRPEVKATVRPSAGARAASRGHAPAGKKRR
jgi:hypothetical protein